MYALPVSFRPVHGLLGPGLQPAGGEAGTAVSAVQLGGAGARSIRKPRRNGGASSGNLSKSSLSYPEGVGK